MEEESIKWNALRLEVRQQLTLIETYLEEFNKLNSELVLNSATSSSFENQVLARVKDLKEAIENDIEKIECLIQKLSTNNKNKLNENFFALSASQIAQVRRFKEIVNGLRSEFKLCCNSVDSKLERHVLLSFRNETQSPEETLASRELKFRNDSNMHHLLRERISLDTSLSILNDVIESSVKSKESLKESNIKFFSMKTKIENLSQIIPQVSKLLTKIKNVKFRHKCILAAVLSLCLLFCIWWIFTGGGKYIQN